MSAGHHGMCLHAPNPAAVLHRATSLTLCLPSILDWATGFHVCDEDEATQDTIDAKVLWHHLQTVEHWFWTHATSTDWWEWINLGTWDKKTMGPDLLHVRATFMDTAAQLTSHITCQDGM